MEPTNYLLLFIHKDRAQQIPSRHCFEAQYFRTGDIFNFTVRVSLNKFYSIEYDTAKNEWTLLNKTDNEDLFEIIVEKLEMVYDVV